MAKKPKKTERQIMSEKMKKDSVILRIYANEQLTYEELEKHIYGYLALAKNLGLSDGEYGYHLASLHSKPQLRGQ